MPKAELNKAELKVLERLFDNEIKCSLAEKPLFLPAQLKSKELPQLQARGYVEQIVVRVPGHPPCSVTGWVLTLRGNMAYCMSCKDVPDPDEKVSTKNAHL